MIFVYLILLFTLGVSFLDVLDKFNIIEKKKYNIFEKLSLEMISGLLIFVIYMLIIGFLHFEYTFILFYPLIFNFIINFIRYIIRFVTHKHDFKFRVLTKEDLNIKNISMALLFMACISWITYYVFFSLTNYTIYPDEYAVWLLNPKNIFLGKRMDYFINTGLEIYPNFLPLLFSGFYVFINEISVNSIRIFSSVFLLIGLFGIIGFGLRKKLNLNYILLMFLMMFIFYGPMFSIMTSTYADIPFMITYTIGMIYLFEWLVFERKIEYLLISIINLMCYSFLKTEAPYLLCFNIALLIVAKLFYKKLKIENINVKSIIIYSGLLMVLPIIWKIYCIVANFPSRLIVSGSTTFNYNYTVALFTNMSQQMFSSITWIGLMCIFFLGLFVYGNRFSTKNKQLMLLGVITILVNILFLIICYLTIFGAEALTAASYIRYITRVYLIMMIISLLAIEPFFENE